METLELNKKAIKELKSEIKVKSEQQKSLKNQRKTKNLVGERIMDPWKATMDHMSNRNQLRRMYAAYAILRGRKIEDVDSLKFENEWERNSFMHDVHKVVNFYNELVSE